jgi:hypothetical protein
MLTEYTSDYQSFAIICFKEGNAAEKLNLGGSEGVSFRTLAADLLLSGARYLCAHHHHSSILIICSFSSPILSVSFVFFVVCM